MKFLRALLEQADVSKVSVRENGSQEVKLSEIPYKGPPYVKVTSGEDVRRLAKNELKTLICERDALKARVVSLLRENVLHK